MTAEVSETVEISRTAWEMAQWEIHYLRSVVTTYWSDATINSRRAKARRQEYLAGMERALRDPEFRRSMTRDAVQVRDECPDQTPHFCNAVGG